MADISTHYDHDYFNWQRVGGEFGGWANAYKFKEHLSPSDHVLDFGCGGGYLLKNIDCARRVGVEINPSAQSQARANGLEVYTSTTDIAGETIDAIVSNHALEHTTDPLGVLRDLRRLLKPGGRLVIAVPCETLRWRYDPRDHNKHLFTWSPMSLGNLLETAGFEVESSRANWKRWPPRAVTYGRLLGGPAFRTVCEVYGRCTGIMHEVIACGSRPK